MIVEISNIRCFNGKNSAKLKPLTILVGENNTGKSTFLSAAHTIVDRLNFPFNPEFKKPPYNIEGFESTVHENSTEFSIGVKEEGSEIRCTYEDLEGEIAPKYISIDNEMGFISVKFNFANDEKGWEIKYEHEGGSGNVEMDAFGYNYSKDMPAPGGVAGPLFALMMRDDNDLPPEVFSIPYADIGESYDPVSIAPIRSKPNRVYSRSSDIFKPTGEHIFSAMESPDGGGIIESIRSFGRNSGLFEDVRIEPLGDKYEDPFKFLVQIEGVESNLSDVGYGVGQVIPIVAQIYLTGEVMMVQQPEVHLHPRAQAELGSLFASVSPTLNHPNILIETHSDYIIDRIRQEVSDEDSVISSDDVSILFFDKKDDEVNIHEISIDDMGNIKNDPPSYRSFFLEEEMRLLDR